MDARETGRLAAGVLAKRFAKQAGIFQFLGRSARGLGRGLGKGLGKGLEWVAGAKSPLAAKGVARSTSPAIRAARKAKNLSSGPGRFSIRKLPAAAGAYAVGEGLYSLGQGDKSLGKQWDQTITKGRLEGGTIGGGKEYLKRLLLRPASTLYGTVFGYSKPGVSANTSPSEWQPGAGGKLQRTVSQTGKKPYWLKLREQQFRQAEQGRQETYLKQQQDLERKLREFEAKQRELEKSRRSELDRLKKILQEQGISPEASPQPQPGEAEKRLKRYQALLRGEDTSQRASRPTPSPSESSETPSSEPSRRSRGLPSELLLAGAVPAAGASANSKPQPEDEEQARLREILRQYYQR